MTVPVPADLVARALECDPASLTPDSALNGHPQWDSFGHLRVMMAIESHYGIAISEESILRFQSMAAIVEHYEKVFG